MSEGEAQTRDGVTFNGLVALQLNDFRSFTTASLEPGRDLTVVFGANAAGKTSLLEAIHVLGRARSFQRAPVDRLGRADSPGFIVRATIEAGREYRVGVQRAEGQFRVRCNGADVRSLSELAGLLPVHVINTESQRLLTDGPSIRRSFLNWGVFHVEHRFSDIWRRYERALRQRNAALKAGDARMVEAVTPTLVEAANEIDALRARFTEDVGGYWREQMSRWLPGCEVRWEYRRGWSREGDLAAVLGGAREREMALGFTLHGPHRADLRLKVDGVEAVQRLSRGQQKLAVMALTLGLVRRLAAEGSARPVLLIDDLPAELDEERRVLALDEALRSGGQVVVTAIERSLIPATGVDGRWFHVEQGRVREVV